MRLTRIVASAMIVSGVGFGSVAVGTPIASARPTAPMPQKPGHGNDDYCPPWCGDTRGPNRYCPPWCDNNAGNNGRGHDDWDKGPWWASNRHDWWDDRNGPPPWGWGPPPPYQWNGGPLPQSVDYYGYNAAPVWNGGQWGIWLFGLWIPIFGVGIN
jgi:hypothetical protein